MCFQPIAIKNHIKGLCLQLYSSIPTRLTYLIKQTFEQKMSISSESPSFHWLDVIWAHAQGCSSDTFSGCVGCCTCLFVSAS